MEIDVNKLKNKVNDNPQCFYPNYEKNQLRPDSRLDPRQADKLAYLNAMDQQNQDMEAEIIRRIANPTAMHNK